MDQEAREKIAAKIYNEFAGVVQEDFDLVKASGYIANEALFIIEELGYRKIKNKPPLLSGDEMGKVKFDMGSPWGVGDRYTVGRAIAQAQREADIKWYEG